MLGRAASLSYKEAFSGKDWGSLDLSHLALTRNYFDRDIGLRNPDWPGGFFSPSNGVIEAYAGHTRTYWTLQGDVLTLSNRFVVSSNLIFFKTDHISNFVINSKHFASNLFEGKDKVVVHKEGSLGLDQVYLLLPDSRVQEDGSISPVAPLNRVIQAQEAFTKIDEDPTFDDMKMIIIDKAIKTLWR
jgi:hypothetical protein